MRNYIQTNQQKDNEDCLKIDRSICSATMVSITKSPVTRTHDILIQTKKHTRNLDIKIQICLKLEHLQTLGID